MIGALAVALYAAWYYWWVLDTRAPTADTVDVTILIGESVSPEQFVDNIEDESEVVSIEFVEEPDTLAHSNQIVRVRISDEHGNNAIFEARLIIRINTTPPVIEGTESIISRLGNPIIYRQGVTAQDDFGRDLTDYIDVDSSNVNHNVVGEHYVTYKVTDKTGLVTMITETVQVLDVDIDYVNARVDEALYLIMEDGKSQLDLVKDIHSQVMAVIATYSPNRIEPANSYEGAYRALRDRAGNCFNYYALGEIMLTRAGIPNMEINRISGTETRHRWSLVNPDNLGWHHFDATPTRLQWGAQTAFFTGSQARYFSRQFLEYNGTRDFYTYNPELYPTIVD